MLWFKNNIWWIILSIAFIISRFNTSDPIIYDNSELIRDIDSLNNELNVLKLQRDSLQGVIDSSKVKVKVINNWYEKELINITNQSIADDVVFFTEYLSKAYK